MRLNLAVKLVAAVALAIAVALIAATKAIDFERYKGFVADLVKAETGRTLTFSGPLRLRLGLVPSLIAEGVSLSNAAGGSRPEMIKIERIEAEVALPALLRKEILVQRLIVSSPDIVLEKGNWRLFDGSGKSGGGTPTRFNLRELKIKNARITWFNDAGQQSLFALHKLTLVPEQGLNGAVGVSVKGDSLGKYFEVNGKIGNLGQALAGKPWPIVLKGAGPGTILGVDGVVANLPAASGLDLKLSFQTDDLGELLRVAGLAELAQANVAPMRLSARISDSAGHLGITELDASAGRRDTVLVSIKGSVKDVLEPAGIEASVQLESENLSRIKLPSGLALPAIGPLHFSATIRDGKDVWALTSVKAAIGGSDLAGEISWRHTNGRPQLAATLQSSRLVVADFIAAGTNGANHVERLIPATALPRDALRETDGDITLKADTVALPVATLTGVAAQAQWNKGLFSLPVASASWAGGSVDAALGLDARAKLTQMNLRLDARDVDFGRVVHEAGSDLLNGGPGELKIALKGRGESLRAVAASASGSAVLSIGPGQVRNRAFNWAGADAPTQIMAALNPLAQQNETTGLTCAVVHFRVKDGLAIADKGVAVQTDGVDVVGAGTVNLRDESLDLGFTPRAKEGLGLSLGGQLAGMTRLRGTLTRPEVSIDEIGAARTALSAGAAAATGGLSLLGELLVDKVIADDTPCRTALGQGKAAGKSGGDDFLESLFGR